MRRFMIMVAVALLAAACSNSDSAPQTTAAITTSAVVTVTTAPATTTTGATTTTAAPTTTTTMPPAIAYVVGTPELYPPAPLAGSAGASGSGCTPGAGPLPDGAWYGFVEDKGASTVDFDLACFFFGDIAYTRGAEDGEEVADDYYVRDQNPTIRTVPVAPGAMVYDLDGGSTTFLTLTFADWTPDPPPLSAGYWLMVNGGEVTEIMDQFAP